jgi:flagellar biosynthesis/type III secretory pathway protein FliH
MSLVVKLSRVERLINAANRVPISPKPDDPYLAKIRAILDEERAEGIEWAAREVRSEIMAELAQEYERGFREGKEENETH